MDDSKNAQDCDFSDSEVSDESAEIRYLIASFQQQGLHHPDDNNDNDDDDDDKHVQVNSKRKGRKKKNKIKSRPQKALDHLKQRVSELMEIFEEHGLWIPPPESLSEKGKVWSSRIYGADKKQQRKNAERMLVENRIAQLQSCLEKEHGISLS